MELCWGVHVPSHHPLFPPPKLTQTHSQSLCDGLKPGSWHTAGPLPAWVKRGCVDTAGVGRGAEKSSDLTGVKAPRSDTHTHKHTHALSTCDHRHPHSQWLRTDSHYVLIVFLCIGCLKFLLRHIYCLQCFSFAQECVYETLSDCLFFLPLWIIPPFQHGHTLSLPQVSPFLFL